MCNERAFFDVKSNTLRKTFKYVFDGLSFHVLLPDITNQVIISSVLSIRLLVVRIGIEYIYKSTIRVLFGSGVLLNNELVLTCAHNFDPIEWGDEKIPFRKIYISSSDPANSDLFLEKEANNSLIECQLIQRGLKKENISKYDELKSTDTDLAILKLNQPPPYLPVDTYFDPKLTSSSSKSNTASINSNLFLVGYNGEVDKSDLNPYEHIKGFKNVTPDALNYHHNADSKSISIGRLIQESFSDNQYAMHNCSTLPGSSGAAILDAEGRFIGIHIGVANSRTTKKNKSFYTEETFNRFIPVYSTAFNLFIDEAIVPNLDNEQLVRKWQCICH
jgi:hypothetical protein